MAATGLPGAAGAVRRAAGISAAIGGCLLLGACASAPGSLLGSAKPRRHRIQHSHRGHHHRQRRHHHHRLDRRPHRARQGHRVLGQGLRPEPARSPDRPQLRAQPQGDGRKAAGARRAAAGRRPQFRPSRHHGRVRPAGAGVRPRHAWPRSCSSRPTIRSTRTGRSCLGARHRARQAEPVQQGHSAVRAGSARWLPSSPP